MAIRALDDLQPRLPDGFVFVADSAEVIGNVELGEDVGIWFGAPLFYPHYYPRYYYPPTVVIPAPAPPLDMRPNSMLPATRQARGSSIIVPTR